eukprot:6909587-Prymnesium_polylepis.1
MSGVAGTFMTVRRRALARHAHLCGGRARRRDAASAPPLREWGGVQLGGCTPETQHRHALCVSGVECSSADALSDDGSVLGQRPRHGPRPTQGGGRAHRHGIEAR